jgi:hypothetical protein
VTEEQLVDVVRRFADRDPQHDIPAATDEYGDQRALRRLGASKDLVIHGMQRA